MISSIIFRCFFIPKLIFPDITCCLYWNPPTDMSSLFMSCFFYRKHAHHFTKGDSSGVPGTTACILTTFLEWESSQSQFFLGKLAHLSFTFGSNVFFKQQQQIQPLVGAVIDMFTTVEIQSTESRCNHGTKQESWETLGNDYVIRKRIQYHDYIRTGLLASAIDHFALQKDGVFTIFAACSPYLPHFALYCLEKTLLNSHKTKVCGLQLW